MKKTPKTPDQLTKQLKSERKTFSFSLYKPNVEQMVEHAKAADIPVSFLLDEAIESYLNFLKTSEKTK